MSELDGTKHSGQFWSFFHWNKSDFGTCPSLDHWTTDTSMRHFFALNFCYSWTDCLHQMTRVCYNSNGQWWCFFGNNVAATRTRFNYWQIVQHCFVQKPWMGGCVCGRRSQSGTHFWRLGLSWHVTHLWTGTWVSPFRNACKYWRIWEQRCRFIRFAARVSTPFDSWHAPTFELWCVMIPKIIQFHAMWFVTAIWGESSCRKDWFDELSIQCLWVSSFNKWAFTSSPEIEFNFTWFNVKSRSAESTCLAHLECPVWVLPTQVNAQVEACWQRAKVQDVDWQDAERSGTRDDDIVWSLRWTPCLRWCELWSTRGWSSLICVSSSKCVHMCVKFRVHFGSILGPFWVHFGSILGPFWVHFGSILGRFWVHFWVHFACCLSGDASFNRYLDKNAL